MKPRLLRNRFWEKANVGDEDECWQWQASTNLHGYGRIRHNGRIRKAHRVSYELNRGEIGDSLVLHHCDNPPCVNPRHLYLGDHKDNAIDAIERGRLPVGEEHYQSSLTEESVVAARNQYWNEDISQGELAERYGVARGTIGDAVTGRTWKKAGGPVKDMPAERQHIRGEWNGSTDLTEKDIREIRQKHENEGTPMAKLGNEYGISNSTVHSIVHRKTWAHVE